MRSRHAASASRRFPGPSSIRTRCSTRLPSCCDRPGTITASRRCSGRGCRRWKTRDARRSIRPSVARGNVDKIYLKDLEAAGIAIPRTRWLDRIDAGSIDRILQEESWTSAVLKPRIAATAYGTFLVEHGTSLSDDELVPARASGAMLQEMIPEVVERGEISLVFLGGVFSHAVVKRAKPGDFRVQKDFGGSVEVDHPVSCRAVVRHRCHDARAVNLPLCPC